MNCFRVIVLVSLVLVFAAVAGAQTIDPSIIILGAGGTGTVSIPGSTFSFSTTTGSNCIFTSPAGTGCLIMNNNSGGGNWIGVRFLISQTVTPLSLVTCNTAQTGSLFTSCVVTSVPAVTGDPTMVTFSGGPGIPFGTEALISIGLWNAGTTFAGTATVTPEPASIALLLTGGGLLLARRKLRKGSHATQR
jgi:hypothetical protein